MQLIDLIQLLLRNKKWVILFPMLAAVGVYYMTADDPKTYSSEMVVYTGLASGYDPEGEGDGNPDFHVVNSKFDNLINTATSIETRKEVAVQLLAHALQNTDTAKAILRNTPFEPIAWLISDNELSAIHGDSIAATVQNIRTQLASGAGNKYYQLMFGKVANPFNVNTLNGVHATRVGSSDMIKIDYTAQDPWLTKETLDILAEVFLGKYKTMRIGEVSNVVKYFEEQTALALADLQKAENTLRNFRADNKVINYYEQTKYVADQKETFETRQSDLQMELDGYKSALVTVENKLDNHTLAKLQSDEIMKKRNALAGQVSAASLAQISGQPAGDSPDENILAMKNDLRTSVSNLYNLNNSLEGVPGKSLLDEWLELTLNLDRTTAQLSVLEKNKSAFEKVFDTYAPMGSDLSKLERDEDVAEKEYLNLLHNLNQAKLRERNLQVSENISVIDAAAFPMEPNPSKRMMLIIAAGMCCFIAATVLLVVREFMDDSIASPLRVKELLNLKTAGAYPDPLTGERNQELINSCRYKWNLSLIAAHNAHPDKLNVLIVPFHGLKNAAEKYGNEMLAAMNDPAFSRLLSPSGNDVVEHDELNVLPSSDMELATKKLIDHTDIIYVCVDAQHRMDPYEMQSLENWKSTGKPVEVVLLNTKSQHLEKYLGEIPKKRSRLRKSVKNIIKKYS